jgi:epoxyqueuosine reductase QueG
VKEERKSFYQLPDALLEKLPLAIVIGKRVSSTVLDTLKDGPNLIYYHHYRQLNFLLDRAAQSVAYEIERWGYYALPIAASQVVDWKRQVAHVSHKRLACLAGLGWRGRNNLLVTGQWGARVRLASVLTNFPLQPGEPAKRDCGSCTRCLSICPAEAIKEDPANFDHLACYRQLQEFSKARGIGQHICGLCVKACYGIADNGRSHEA